MSGIKTNPNAFGGSFNYDSRTGLGYGQVTNNGLGSEWDMGDALSSPKGEWDNDTSEYSCDCEEDCDCLNKIEIDIELKTHTSTKQFNKDSGSGQSSRDPFSFNPLSNTSAYLGASHKRNDNALLREYITLLIDDVLIKEESLGMGGMTAVRSAGQGIMYKKDTANSVSGYGMGGGTYGTNKSNKPKKDKGYTQNGVTRKTDDGHDLGPYVEDGDAVTDGSRVVYNSEQQTDWYSEEATGMSLATAISDEEQGKASFKKHSLKNHYFK